MFLSHSSDPILYHPNLFISSSLQFTLDKEAFFFQNFYESIDTWAKIIGYTTKMPNSFYVEQYILYLEVRMCNSLSFLNFVKIDAMLRLSIWQTLHLQGARP